MRATAFPRALNDTTVPEGRLEEGAGASAGEAGLPLRGLARYDSQALFGAAVEVEIVHRQQVYRLRRTAQGKLILTK